MEKRMLIRVVEKTQSEWMGLDTILERYREGTMTKVEALQAMDAAMDDHLSEGGDE